MIDVGGDDGAAARDLRANKLRRHEGGQARAEALAVGKPRFRFVDLPRAPDIFSMRDIVHLLGDDPGARQFELGDESAIPPCIDPRRAQAWQSVLHVDCGIAIGVRAGRIVEL